MYELDEIWMVIAGSTIGIHECAKANRRIKAEDQRIEKKYGKQTSTYNQKQPLAVIELIFFGRVGMRILDDAGDADRDFVENKSVNNTS